ncbi:MAG TPA: hypothetical protein VIM77_05805 [Mucilaginibacter sp.]
MNYRFYYITLLTVAATAVLGCGGNAPQTPAAPVAVKKPALMEPFRYHKLLEVSPGQTYDVFSWGRGSQEVGAFMILHSDSSAIKYTITTGDLEGSIIDAYNADMDVDGNPEILITAKSKDTVNRTRVYAFEFNDSKANKLDFPKLNSSQRKGYRGEDNFYIRDGKLMREFPIYDGTGKEAKPTGAKRQLEYGLSRNEFTVKQLSKDSTDKSVKPADNVPAKQTEAKSTSSKSEKKVSSSKSSKKKKHKRHRN